MSRSIVLAVALAASADAFAPALTSSIGARARAVVKSDPRDEQLGFTAWKPKGDGMTNEYGSTDTGDYFEDGDENSHGLGDQGMTKKEAGNKLDELLTTDSWTIGGRQALTSAPKWFTPTPGSLEGSLSYESSGKTLFVSVSNGGMGYEDFFADFSEETVGNFEVTPQTGTLERRGGAPQEFSVVYKGGGKSGTTGHLIVQTEEDKFTYELVVP